MTKEQAEEMLSLLRDIREQVTVVANNTRRDGTFTFYSRPDFGAAPNSAQSGAELQTKLDMMRGG
jgi:hypothetical protein